MNIDKLLAAMDLALIRASGDDRLIGFANQWQELAGLVRAQSVCIIGLVDPDPYGLVKLNALTTELADKYGVSDD